ncbi:hypothetical protein ACN47E_001575 [Coniothyrium glycines]
MRLLRHVQRAVSCRGIRGLASSSYFSLNRFSLTSMQAARMSTPCIPFLKDIQITAQTSLTDFLFSKSFTRRVSHCLARLIVNLKTSFYAHQSILPDILLIQFKSLHAATIRTKNGLIALDCIGTLSSGDVSRYMRVSHEKVVFLEEQSNFVLLRASSTFLCLSLNNTTSSYS